MVPVVVNDGENDSSPFTVKIIVAPVNDAPVITGNVALSTNENTLIALGLNQLTVTDPDNKYPGDFTLIILNGDNYSAAGNIISPAIDFTGTLRVAVMVNDGTMNSPVYPIKIDVIAPTVNIPPSITGQRNVTTGRNTPVTLKLSHLLVTDPDNTYPQGFKLKVLPGAGYLVDGTTVTPDAAIANGTFAVTVTVNDGKDVSQPFQLKIEVISPTAKPRIISQKN